jgi:iron complex outermembrane receptor protein
MEFKPVHFLTYANNGPLSQWVAGANLYTDEFKEDNSSTAPLRDYNQITYGAFIQNTVKANDWLDIETVER